MLLDALVQPRVAAGEDHVGLVVEQVAGRPAGRERLADPCRPAPEPDRVEVGVADHVHGDHGSHLTRARRRTSRRCSRAARRRGCCAPAGTRIRRRAQERRPAAARGRGPRSGVPERSTSRVSHPPPQNTMSLPKSRFSPDGFHARARICTGLIASRPASMRSGSSVAHAAAAVQHDLDGRRELACARGRPHQRGARGLKNSRYISRRDLRPGLHAEVVAEEDHVDRGRPPRRGTARGSRGGSSTMRVEEARAPARVRRRAAGRSCRCGRGTGRSPAGCRRTGR